jgi:alcohol dehydrogenase YqhD (iron-dependent ADH family)
MYYPRKCRVTVAKDEKNNVQGILAVGGNSVIDSAKAIVFGRNYKGFILYFYKPIYF